MSDRERAANERLTAELQKKCDDMSLRVVRIRWGTGEKNTAEIDIQRDVVAEPPSVETFTVPLEKNFAKGVSCFEDEVVNLVAAKFRSGRYRTRFAL